MALYDRTGRCRPEFRAPQPGPQKMSKGTAAGRLALLSCLRLAEALEPPATRRARARRTHNLFNLSSRLPGPETQKARWVTFDPSRLHLVVHRHPIRRPDSLSRTRMKRCAGISALSILVRHGDPNPHQGGPPVFVLDYGHQAVPGPGLHSPLVDAEGQSDRAEQHTGGIEDVESGAGGVRDGMATDPDPPCRVHPHVHECRQGGGDILQLERSPDVRLAVGFRRALDPGFQLGLATHLVNWLRGPGPSEHSHTVAAVAAPHQGILTAPAVHQAAVGMQGMGERRKKWDAGAHRGPRLAVGALDRNGPELFGLPVGHPEGIERGPFQAPSNVRSSPRSLLALERHHGRDVDPLLPVDLDVGPVATGAVPALPEDARGVPD